MNHVSLFDHFVIVVYIKHYVAAIAKFEQFKYPLWGAVAKHYGIVPINRSNIKKAMDSLKIVEESIVNNRISFIVAPEGTRSKDGSLGEFKKGAFHIAKNTEVSIVPVIINGAFEAKNKSDYDDHDNGSGDATTDVWSFIEDPGYPVRVETDNKLKPKDKLGISALKIYISKKYDPVDAEKQSKKFVVKVDRIFPEFKKKMSKRMKKTLKEIKKKKWNKIKKKNKIRTIHELG